MLSLFSVAVEPLSLLAENRYLCSLAALPLGLNYDYLGGFFT
jgi:hypothetical protein